MEGFQRNYIAGSFPINSTVFEEKVMEAMDPRYTLATTGVFDGDEEFIPTSTQRKDPLSQEDADMIMTIVNNAPIMTEDEALQNIILEAALDFFNGRITVQDAARIIQSRAEIFISEQN